MLVEKLHYNKKHMAHMTKQKHFVCKCVHCTHKLFGN